MPGRCTCGAYPPDDALFCHRCGKPQRDLLPNDEVYEPEPVAETPPPIPVIAEPAAPPIGFRNAQAVRIGMVAGILSIVICALGGTVAPLLAPLWMIVSGMVAAFIYKLRTGRRLSPISGARLGWISGIFGFIIIAIMLAVFVAAATNYPAVIASIREQSAQAGRSSAEVDALVDEFRHPSKVLMTLPFFFLLFTVLSAFGGAIGARLLDRD